MLTRQCYFKDEGADTIMGGIYVDNGDEKYIICGCCGGVYDKDDIENLEVFELYESWVDISEEIKGDM